MSMSSMMWRFSAVVLTATALVACSTPSQQPQKPQVKYQSKPQNRAADGTKLSPTPAPLPVIRSQDGFQDLRWTIQEINGRRAQFFTQYPSLLLQSQNQRIFGHTGCNAIFGQYQVNTANQNISFKANAEHLACDNALAQEAELMEALSRISHYQIQGKNMTLFDKSNHVLIRANY